MRVPQLKSIPQDSEFTLLCLGLITCWVNQLDGTSVPRSLATHSHDAVEALFLSLVAMTRALNEGWICTSVVDSLQ